jgi:transcriptional regulator with XRE-family HTH domain
MNVQPVGIHLRQWRQRRRLSQLDLAHEAEISPRHLSFVETGRSTPSREMILHLAEQLEIPMRERNILLVAAGYAPLFPERPLHDPALQPARAAIDVILESHKPYPAFAIDRHWTVVASNRALQVMYEGTDPDLLAPPVNAVRLSLSPRGLGPRVENYGEWRAHVVARLTQQVELTADPKLADLLREVKGYPIPLAAPAVEPNPMAVPFKLRTAAGVLSFFTTTMVFGSPVDITLSELAVELFFPANAATADLVKQLT